MSRTEEKKTTESGKKERPAKRAARLAIRAGGGAINLFLTLAMLLMIGLGAYKIWDSYMVEEAALAANYAKYRPEVPKAGPTYEELRAINPDVVGWITVYGTNIDYPIVQGEDNWTYLYRDAFGNYSLTGSIYLDSDNASDFSDFNSILYGHNMTPAVMFGNVKDFREESFFETHRYGDIYFGDAHHGLEFFVVVEEDSYDEQIYTPGVEGEENRLAYLQRLDQDAVQKRDIGVTTQDQICLLSTCSPMRTNMRDILVARISDETYEDPFGDATGEPMRFEKTRGQRLLEFLKKLPLAAWILIFLPVVLLLLLLITGSGRGRKETTEDEDERTDSQADDTDSE